MSRSAARMPLFAWALVSAAAAGAACSGPLVVAPEEVAKQIRGQVEQQRGRPVDSVTCPAELKGEVGAMLRCEVREGEVVTPAMVTVTRVDGNTVDFDVTFGAASR